jgi:hypothetical protein
VLIELFLLNNCIKTSANIAGIRYYAARKIIAKYRKDEIWRKLPHRVNRKKNETNEEFEARRQQMREINAVEPVLKSGRTGERAASRKIGKIENSRKRTKKTKIKREIKTKKSLRLKAH